jgi:hypothetical protein
MLLSFKFRIVHEFYRQPLYTYSHVIFAGDEISA